jgi:tetratricopeptide (TPR) repeat protein
VCSDSDLAASELADIVHALVDKSLVVAVPAGDDVRFTQLQTLAQYGREKLAERGDSERTRDAMASHFTRLCAGSAAAFIGDDQRGWLIAVDRERDNIRGALEWAVANDDAESALTIAGGMSWPHWLAGTALEGTRWLDDAFGCRGEVSDRARALGLVGRGLLDFQIGRHGSVDAYLEEALRISRAHGDVGPTALAFSFYAEFAAARGETEEAKRRRKEVLDFYLALPDHAFVLGARAYSRAKIAVLDGDHALAEECYRAAADGFSRTDRPMMRTICLGIIADFEERSGDFGAAIASLEAAIEINDALGLRGFNGALLGRLGWVLLQVGDVRRAEAACERALDLGRRLGHTSAVFTALSALAVVHHRLGRNADAIAAADEALELQRASSARRLSNRIDVDADVAAAAAACREVLAQCSADAAGVQSGFSESAAPIQRLHRR